MSLERAYGEIDNRRETTQLRDLSKETVVAALREVGVNLKAVGDRGNPAHYRARVATEYGAAALRALDSIVQAGEAGASNSASPSLPRLPAMCPDPDPKWREAKDPEATWRELAFERHGKLDRVPIHAQATLLCELIGLCAGLLDYFEQQNVTPS